MRSLEAADAAEMRAAAEGYEAAVVVAAAPRTGVARAADFLELTKPRITIFVLLATNFIMNVAAIAITLPVALVIAPYLDVAPEVVLFASLAAAGMPFLLLVGAAPNAIAYGSRQFSSGQFFLAGIPASILLLVVVGIFVRVVWPLMGMPILAP